MAAVLEPAATALATDGNTCEFTSPAAKRPGTPVWNIGSTSIAATGPGPLAVRAELLGECRALAQVDPHEKKKRAAAPAESSSSPTKGVPVRQRGSTLGTPRTGVRHASQHNLPHRDSALSRSCSRAGLRSVSTRARTTQQRRSAATAPRSSPRQRCQAATEVSGARDRALRNGRRPRSSSARTRSLASEAQEGGGAP